jgi:hypothetical protein
MGPSLPRREHKYRPSLQQQQCLHPYPLSFRHQPIATITTQTSQPPIQLFLFLSRVIEIRKLFPPWMHYSQPRTILNGSLLGLSYSYKMENRTMKGYGNNSSNNPFLTSHKFDISDYMPMILWGPVMHEVWHKLYRGGKIIFYRLIPI